jgi:alginate O-acetyltransferase complex protein AlgI
MFFYGWWNLYFLPILIVSILINFAISKKIQSIEKNENKLKIKKIYFLAGLVFNLSLLGYFKYRDFFVDTANQVLQTNFPILNLALPLGISFFTLQQIAFLVDTYEDLAEEPSFIDYAIFVSFFPQLIAGPIVHHAEMMPQFSSSRNLSIDYKNIAKGILIFFVGLFKKVIIADTFAEWATTGFDDAVFLTFAEAWAASMCFTFQVYFDFSGYSDMAVGLALLFNINITNNFNSPYKATSIINFWSRWHITLTRFITTYIYTPIIKNCGNINFFNAMVATFLAMLIAGLWHGAAWTFVIFGAMHGIALVANHIWKKRKLACPNFLGWLMTLNFVNVSFVIFRAKECEDAIKVFKGMLGLSGVVVTEDLIEAIPIVKSFGFYVGDHLLNLEASDDVFRMIALAGILVLLGKNSTHIKNSFKMNWLAIIILSLIFLVSILRLGKESPFLYFNF